MRGRNARQDAVNRCFVNAGNVGVRDDMWRGSTSPQISIPWRRERSRSFRRRRPDRRLRDFQIDRMRVDGQECRKMRSIRSGCTRRVNWLIAEMLPGSGAHPNGKDDKGRPCFLDRDALENGDVQTAASARQYRRDERPHRSCCPCSFRMRMLRTGCEILCAPAVAQATGLVSQIIFPKTAGNISIITVHIRTTSNDRTTSVCTSFQAWAKIRRSQMQVIRLRVRCARDPARSHARRIGTGRNTEVNLRTLIEATRNAPGIFCGTYKAHNEEAK